MSSLRAISIFSSEMDGENDTKLIILPYTFVCFVSIALIFPFQRLVKLNISVESIYMFINLMNSLLLLLLLQKPRAVLTAVLRCMFSSFNFVQICNCPE